MGTGSMSHVKVCVSVCLCRSPAIPRQPRHLQTSNFQCRYAPTNSRGGKKKIVGFFFLRRDIISLAKSIG